MQFQWYPGHMTKAKRQMQEDIKLIDLVIELVDARIPLSSRNQICQMRIRTKNGQPILKRWATMLSVWMREPRQA